MKKLLHFLVVLLGIFVAFILARLFIEIYTIVGDVYLQVDNKTITLYKVLAEIDYLSVGITFAMVFCLHAPIRLNCCCRRKVMV